MEEKFRIQMRVSSTHTNCITIALHLRSIGTYTLMTRSFTEAGSFRDRHAFPRSWSDINCKSASRKKNFCPWKTDRATFEGLHVEVRLRYTSRL